MGRASGEHEPLIDGRMGLIQLLTGPPPPPDGRQKPLAWVNKRAFIRACIRSIVEIAGPSALHNSKLTALLCFNFRIPSLIFRHNRKLAIARRVILFLTTLPLTSAGIARACDTPFGEMVLGGEQEETIHAVVAKNAGQFALIGSQDVGEDKRRGFVWMMDACGRLSQKMTLSPNGGSSFVTGTALADGSVLVGGSIASREDAANSDGLLLHLEATGKRSWIRTFHSDRSVTVTNLIDRGAAITLVLQPVERAQEGDTAAPTPLKPHEERPIFLDLDLNGNIAEEYLPLSEEKIKLFHLSHVASGDTLYASGRFSYFGQPTRPGMWEINRQTGLVRRLYSGDSIGLSFGSHSTAAGTQLSFLWRSKLSDKGTTAPISLTRLSDGSPQEIWSLPAQSAATLPAAQRLLSNGDLALVLQSYPEKNVPTEISVLRLSPDGARLWQKAFTRPYKSAITSLIELENGGLMLAGRTSANGTTDGDAWLIALDRHGTQSGPSRQHKW